MWVNRNHELTDLSGFIILILHTSGISFKRKMKNWNYAIQKFLCSYLDNPKHKLQFLSNAPGCNTREEILASCTTGTDEEYTSSNTAGVFPNPCPLKQQPMVYRRRNRLPSNLVQQHRPKTFEGKVSNPVNLPVNQSGLYYYKSTSAGKQKSGALVVLE